MVGQTADELDLVNHLQDFVIPTLERAVYQHRNLAYLIRSSNRKLSALWSEVIQSLSFSGINSCYSSVARCFQLISLHPIYKQTLADEIFGCKIHNVSSPEEQKAWVEDGVIHLCNDLKVLMSDRKLGLPGCPDPNWLLGFICAAIGIENPELLQHVPRSTDVPAARAAKEPAHEVKPETKPEPPPSSSHPPQKPSAPIPKKKAPPKKAPPTAPTSEPIVKTAPKPDGTAQSPPPVKDPVSGYSVAPQALEAGQSSAYSTMHLGSDGVVVIHPQKLSNTAHKGRNRGITGRRLPTRGVRRGTNLQLVDSTPTSCTLQLQDPDVPRGRKFARLTARQTYNCAQCNSTLLTGTDYFKDEGHDLFDPANRYCADCVGQSAPKKPDPVPEPEGSKESEQKRFVAPYLAHASESTIQRDFAEKAQGVQLEKAYETNEQKQKRLQELAVKKAALKEARVDESESVRSGYEAKIEEELEQKINQHLQEDMLQKAKAAVLEVPAAAQAKRNPQPSMSAQVLADVQRANTIGSVGTDGLTSVRRWMELKEEQLHEKVAARVVKELKKEGVMFKKGGKKNTKRWQQRTFKLERGYLRYYKTDKKSKSKDGPPQQYLAEFQLNRECRIEVTQDKKKRYPFILRTPARVYKLACDSEEERNSWIDALSVVAFYMQRESAIIESAQESKHEFQLFHFDRPTWCDFCGKFVWGVVGKQAYLCRDCNYAAHKKCLADVPNQCASKLGNLKNLLSSGRFSGNVPVPQ